MDGGHDSTDPSGIQTHVGGTEVDPLVDPRLATIDIANTDPCVVRRT